MKNSVFFLFFIVQLSLSAQPTFVGTMLTDGNYTTFNLDDLGAFRQVRLQAVNGSGVNSRIWEFATGNYFENWRPYTFPTTTTLNQVIDPSSDPASARYNTSFGGSSSYLPAITSGNYYTFNVTEFAPPTDQFMSLLETSYAPATIVSVSSLPANNPPENIPVNLTIVTSGNPANNEQFYVRYSTNNFSTSSLVEFSFSGSTGTATMPTFPEGTTVEYYIYSSNFTMASIMNDVSSFGQLAHDMLTLNLDNNGGPNYSYVVQMALPITLSSFELQSSLKGVHLNWETASEINNSHFDIERSTDAIDWNPIAQIKGNETTSNIHKYNLLDPTPVLGTNYYRLKQVDYDDSYSYSNVLSTDWRIQKQVEIYPNPAIDRIFFRNIDSDSTIRIFDLLGRQYFNGYISEGSLDITNLNEGVYIIQYYQSTQSFQKQLLILD